MPTSACIAHSLINYQFIIQWSFMYSVGSIWFLRCFNILNGVLTNIFLLWWIFFNLYNEKSWHKLSYFLLVQNFLEVHSRNVPAKFTFKWFSCFIGSCINPCPVVMTIPHLWRYGLHAHLDCGRLWVQSLVGSKQRL